MKNSEQFDILLTEIYKQNFKGVQDVLREKVDLNMSFRGLLPLVQASGKSNPEIVEILIKNGASVNTYDGLREYTPLMAACEACNISNTKELIKQGADVNFTHAKHISPLSVAVSGDEPDRPELCKYLIECGAIVRQELVSKNGIITNTVFTKASAFGTPAILKILLENGAEIDDFPFFGTPLIAAVKERNIDNVAFLLKNGADKSLKLSISEKLQEFSGKTAKEIAKFKKYKKIYDLL